MNVYRVKTGSILPLGKQGENLARKIQFDISRWISTFGPGTVQLLHQRSGDEAPYPVAVEQEGDCAVWTVTNADTVVPGTGRAELQYYVGDALAKSETWMTKVFPALGDAGDTPPEAQQGWVDQVLAQVSRITGMTAQAVELPAGSAPTADYADGVLTIGIPLGGDVSEAQIAQAVAEYLSKNPIAETDPTVPDWAKQPEKPSYTADEVGSLSSETLPEAITTALAQAKESGEFDGAAGQPGANGKSAYQYAVEGGYTGTEEAFAAKLAEEIPAVDDTLTQVGQAADAAAVGEQLSNLAEEKVDKSVLGLIVGADGKIYVAINGVAIGSGVEITGGTGEDTTYKVELSDGIILNTLMFQDEFDGDGLSSTWKPAYGYYNAALNNWWTADEKNLGVSNGCVRLTMLRDNPTDDFAISAAKIETMQYGAANNYGFDTGYCEVRFKLDKVGDGIWPAIWCVGQTQTDEYTDITATSVTRKIHGYTWPWAGEIDQLDGIGSAFTPGLIYQTDPYDSGLLTMKGSQNVSLEADTWYTIGVYKTKDVIKVYWNRELIDTFDISAINSFSGMGERLIINLSTGKSLGGILPDDVSEVNMFVDYVRVYSLSNGYTTLAEQNTATLLPDYADGFACVSDRKFLLRPQFAENTKNTALHWASSDTAVAKVENGYVTTVADGKCAISATDVNGNQVISFPLTVKADAGVLATDIKIVSDMTSVGVNESVEIEALIYPTNCDSLTPTLTILSGSEYCTVDGSTVHNNNDSGQDQTVTLRVGTNNPVVYEDLEITLKTDVDYTVSITNGLVNDYQAKAKYINTDDTLNMKWTDAVSSVVLNYLQSNAYFDGVKLVKTSTIDVLKNVYMTSFLDGVTAGTFVSAVSNLAAGSGWGYVLSSEDEENGTKTGHYTSVYFSSATNARIRQMPEDGNNTAVWQKNIGFTQNDFLVLVGRVASGTIEYALYNSGGLIGTTGQQTITEVVGDDMTIGAAYVGSSTRGNGIKGNIHQHLVYNRALSDEEIATIAAELVEMHAGNV